ncbi:hypothetical protein JCM15415_21550 [Methanobacterium movens]|nr:MAG: hypothetical protein CIT03_07630 [Methanobacterium sp.]
MKKQLIITLTVLILAITMAGAVSATVDPDSVKYVSPTGSDDNDGTETNPYLTIGKGISSVSADGTVNVADGTYYEHLTIDKNLNLVGQSQENTILDGSNTGTPITINSGATVSIILFTIQNANGHFGGGIGNAYGTLTVNSSTFINNTAQYGGTIFNAYGSNLNVIDCTFTNNHGIFGGGAIYDAEGTSTVTGSTFTNNLAAYGGAIYTYGTVTVNDSTFTGNSATTWGGAIYNYYGYDYDATLTVTNSEFTGNTAPFGGAIYNFATLSVTDSTFTGNSATNYGGAIYNNDNYCSADTTTSTFSGNTATVGGAIFNNWGTVTANFNRVVDNSHIAIHNHGGSADARYNWWGSNNPNFTTLIGGAVDYSPWLYMSFQADPTSIAQGETSTLTANFNHAFDGTTVTSLDPANGHLPDGTLVTFKTDLGEVGSQVVDKPTTSGVAIATLNGTESGLATVKAVLDTEELTDTVQIGAEPPETGIFTRLMVQDAAIRVRNFITSRGVLPNWVRMEDTAGITHYVTMPVFLELSTASLISTAQEFKAMDVKTAPKAVGSTIVNRNLYKSGYMDMASRVNKFIRNNGVAPNFAWSSLGNIRFQALVDSFARIVAFKAERGVLPNYVVINTRRVR